MLGCAVCLLVGLALGAGAVILVLVPEAQKWLKERFGR